MTKPAFRLLSGDAHLEHPASVIRDYVPAKFHDMLPTAHHGLAKGPLAYSGPNGVTLGAMAGFNKFHEIRHGAIDITSGTVPGTYGGGKEYLEWLDMDAVDATVVLPGSALGASMGLARASKDRDGYIAFIQGYNNWLSDFCSADPSRLLGGASIPRTGVDDAIAELKRVAKLPGIKTVAPGAFPSGVETPTPEDDRFWAATLELGMPVTMHGGISSPRNGFCTELDVVAHILGHVEVTTGGPYSITQLILSGLFDRFPELKLIILECGAGWLPFSMDVMNHMYDRYRHWAGLKLKNPPSWYCTSGNVLWNIIADHVAIQHINDIGADNLSWSSDFPHSNSEWPFSRLRAQELTASLSDEDRNKVLWANAARFYGLEDKPATRPLRKAAE